MLNINEYYIRLTGLGFISEPLEIGHHYLISCDGEIVSATDESQEDGTGKRIYKFKPVTIEVLKDGGEVIKAINSGKSLSQKLRHTLWYLAQAKGWDSDQLYNRVMNKLIFITTEHPDELINFLKQFT